MTKSIKFMLSILIILVFIIFIRSMKSTAAMVQIAEIDKQNITLTLQSSLQVTGQSWS